MQRRKRLLFLGIITEQLEFEETWESKEKGVKIHKWDRASNILCSVFLGLWQELEKGY